MLMQEMAPLTELVPVEPYAEFYVFDRILPLLSVHGVLRGRQVRQHSARRTTDEKIWLLFRDPSPCFLLVDPLAEVPRVRQIERICWKQLVSQRPHVHA